MTYKAIIQQVSTGKVAVHEGYGDWEDHSDYMWREGNYGCDCNRALFFHRALGIPEDTYDYECGDGGYRVFCIDRDGTVVYKDEE